MNKLHVVSLNSVFGPCGSLIHSFTLRICKAPIQHSEFLQYRAQSDSQPRLMKQDVKDYLTSLGGPLTKNAAEVGPISKACDGNDELGIRHPSSESIDVSSITESVICVNNLNKNSFEHQTS